jgi:hypothetical protein
VALSRLAALILAVISLYGQPGFFPLSEVRPGLRGTGKTVFSGDRVEEFSAEILGVLENAGPKQSVVLARLSGGPLDKAGVLQGMSGSPVYIDGKLLGAVAFTFAFSTEPLAGIRPIADMLRLPGPGARPPQARVRLEDRQLSHVFEPPEEFVSGGGRLVEIATPLAFSGFTRGTLDFFAPQLRALGLEPAQGVSGGGTPPERLGDPRALQPGSAISVQLLSGDMSISADGTVTYIEDDRIYAFGHRFLSVGSTELPLARAEVLTVAPNLATSFKISAAREWMGAITNDFSAGVSGRLGRRAAMIPVSLSVRAWGEGKQPERRTDYRLQMVNDRYLSPFLLQMAVYSAIDATERTLGTGSLAIRGRVEFQDGTAPLRVDEMYAGEGNVPLQVSLAAAVPMAFLLQGGFESLRPKNVELTIDVFNEKRQWQIDQVWPSRKSVRPGEEVELNILLAGDNGAELSRKARYRVPVGARPGTLNFTVADATTSNLADYQRLAGWKMRSANQLVSFLNGLRSNTHAYVRIWRAETGYRVQGLELPVPPASVALVLGRGQSAWSGAEMSSASEVAELRVDVGDAVVSGAKTIQVEIQE